MVQTLNFQRMMGLVLLTAFAFSGLSNLGSARLEAAPNPETRVISQPATVVNFNKAGLEELQTVRGIGPALAERIIQYRDEHGRFEKLEDVANIRGIGKAKLEKMKTQITI